MGRNPNRIKQLEEIFKDWNSIEIGRSVVNSSLKLNASSFAILHSEGFKVANVLRVPNFRKQFGEGYAEKYKKSLKELKDMGYKIKRHDLIGPHLLRIVT